MQEVPNGSGRCTTRVPGWLDLQDEPSMQLVPEGTPGNRVPTSSLLLREVRDGFAVAPFTITSSDKHTDCERDMQALPEILFIVDPEDLSCEGCLHVGNCSGTCPSSCSASEEEDFTFEITNVTFDEQGEPVGWEGFLEGSRSFAFPSGDGEANFLVLFDVVPQSFF